MPILREHAESAGASPPLSESNRRRRGGKPRHFVRGVPSQAARSTDATANVVRLLGCLFELLRLARTWQVPRNMKLPRKTRGFTNENSFSRFGGLTQDCGRPLREASNARSSGPLCKLTLSNGGLCQSVSGSQKSGLERAACTLVEDKSGAHHCIKTDYLWVERKFGVSRKAWY
jgi:hypothetical protein